MQHSEEFTSPPPREEAGPGLSRDDLLEPDCTEHALAQLAFTDTLLRDPDAERRLLAAIFADDTGE